MPELLATGDVLRRFLDRIDRDLAAEPLRIDPEEHRRQVAELLAACGSGNHYGLLGVRRTAGEAEVHAAYRAAARLVHPRHAESLDMAARREVFQILFERATEAYLVLSDHRRRDDYDRLSAADAHWGRDDEERAEEGRRVARTLHEQAERLIEKDDYHFAIELLRQAVRLDRSAAASWALLGRAQKANPRWLHMASDSLLQAAQLEPGVVGHRLLLAEIELERGNDAHAERLLRQVVERYPDHAEASAALANLLELRARREREAGTESKRTGFFRGRR